MIGNRHPAKGGTPANENEVKVTQAAVVTGAGGDIGESIAEVLVERDWHVVVCDLEQVEQSAVAIVESHLGILVPEDRVRRADEAEVRRYVPKAG